MRLFISSPHKIKFSKAKTKFAAILVGVFCLIFFGAVGYSLAHEPANSNNILVNFAGQNKLFYTRRTDKKEKPVYSLSSDLTENFDPPKSITSSTSTATPSDVFSVSSTPETNTTSTPTTSASSTDGLRFKDSSSQNSSPKQTRATNKKAPPKLTTSTTTAPQSTNTTSTTPKTTALTTNQPPTSPDIYAYTGFNKETTENLYLLSVLSSIFGLFMMVKPGFNLRKVKISIPKFTEQKYSSN